MANKSQAEADSEAEMMVDDPLDASNDPDQGATELDNYFNEVNDLEMADDESFVSEEETHNPEEFESLPKEIAVDGEEEVVEEESSEGEGEGESEEEEPQEEEEEPSSKSDRYRIRAKDDVEAEALSIRKRHPDWSLKECISKAEQLLGIEDKSSKQEEAEPQEKPLTVAAISEKINDLRTKRDQANLALEVEDAAEIQREIDALQDQREEVRFAEKSQEAVTQRREIENFEAQYKSSESKAVKFYPDTTNPDSDLVTRMVELDTYMRENDDPLYHSPDKPFLLAKAAAKDLGIIMTNPSAKPAVKKTPQKNGAPIQPASGSARTTNFAPSRKLDDALDGMETLEDYESFAETV